MRPAAFLKSQFPHRFRRPIASSLSDVTRGGTRHNPRLRLAFSRISDVNVGLYRAVSCAGLGGGTMGVRVLQKRASYGQFGHPPLISPSNPPILSDIALDSARSKSPFPLVHCHVSRSLNRGLTTSD